MSIPLSIYLSQVSPKSDQENEYARDIFQDFQQKEFAIEEKFLNKQAEFTLKHRAILIDWIHSTHSRFKLRPETLFLSIQLLDRYLTVRSIRVSQMQLLGLTVLFLSCKYEEIYSPDLSELLTTCDNVFLKDQVVMLEKDVLKALDFAITKPNSLKFFYRFAEICEVKESLFTFGLYLLELSFDHRMVKFKPSVIASAAICLSHVLFHKASCNLNALLRVDEEVRKCANEMSKILEFARENPLRSVWDKYSKRKNYCVASLALI
jgi:hypothetical protein